MCGRGKAARRACCFRAALVLALVVAAAAADAPYVASASAIFLRDWSEPMGRVGTAVCDTRDGQVAFAFGGYIGNGYFDFQPTLDSIFLFNRTLGEQGKWIPVPRRNPFGSPWVKPRFYAQCASITSPTGKEMILVVGGFSSTISALQEVALFDLETYKFTEYQSEDFFVQSPLVVGQPVSSIVVPLSNGSVFLLSTELPSSNYIFSLNATNDLEWQIVGPAGGFPAPSQCSAAGLVTRNGREFVVVAGGGTQGKFNQLATINAFDVASLEWTQIANMSEQIRNESGGVYLAMHTGTSMLDLQDEEHIVLVGGTRSNAAATPNVQVLAWRGLGHNASFVTSSAVDPLPGPRAFASISRALAVAPAGHAAAFAVFGGVVSGGSQDAATDFLTPTYSALVTRNGSQVGISWVSNPLAYQPPVRSRPCLVPVPSDLPPGLPPPVPETRISNAAVRKSTNQSALPPLLRTTVPSFVMVGGEESSNYLLDGVFLARQLMWDHVTGAGKPALTSLVPVYAASLYDMPGQPFLYVNSLMQNLVIVDLAQGSQTVIELINVQPRYISTQGCQVAYAGNGRVVFFGNLQNEQQTEDVPPLAFLNITNLKNLTYEFQATDLYFPALGSGITVTPSGSVLVFGGTFVFSASSPISDLFVLNSGSSTFVKHSTSFTSVWPEARSWPVFQALNDDFAVLMGGTDRVGNSFNDVYVLSIRTQQWTELPQTGPVANLATWPSSFAGASGVLCGEACVMVLVPDTSSTSQQGLAIWRAELSIESGSEPATSPRPGSSSAPVIVIVGIVCVLAVTFGLSMWYRSRLRRYKRAYSTRETVGTPLLSDQDTSIMVGRSIMVGESVVVSWDDLKFDGAIGAGATSTVFGARWKGVSVAVKRFNVVLDDSLRDKVASEIQILCRLRHPNIVFFLGLAYRDPDLYLVMERCARGDLFSVLHPKENGGGAAAYASVHSALSLASSDLVSELGRSDPAALPISTRVIMSLDAARGLAFLHDQGILHRDVKSLNFLVASDMRVKITDFGLSRFFDPANVTHMTRDVGTLFWSAPEVLRGDSYSYASDVYSFGIVLHEILTGRIPYDGQQIGVVIPKVLSGGRPSLEHGDDWSDDSDVAVVLEELIVECWAQEADDRPTMRAVVERLEALMNTFTT